jgi:tetratricopeptide (TPR) repeat protein
VVVPLRSEKERTALELVEEARGKTRVALDGALRIRRAGSLKGTRDFLPEVQKAFEAAVKRVPDEPELYFLMGRVHRALMEDAEALRFQEQALARDPAYAPALYERIVLVSTRYGDRLEGAWAALRRRGLSMPDGPAEWIAALEQAEKADPELRADRERILRDCEQLKGVLDRDRPKAETEAMGDASVLAARGILAFHRCRYEEAKLLLQDALAKDGSREEAWGALAVATSRAPEPDPKGKEEIRRAVERIYSEALRRDRGYVPHLLGRAHIRLGIVEDRIERGLDPTRDLEGAERDLEAAMELTPRNPWARLALANLRTSRGSYLAGRGLSPLADFAAADGDLAEALRLAPEDREVWKRRGSLRLNAAMARAERGEDPAADFEAAETALNESVKRDPSASDTLNVRGFMRMQRGLWRLKHGGDPGEDFRAAERDLVQAVTLRENYAVAWRNLGQLRFHKGALSATRGGSLLEDFESAEDCFGRALQFEPDQAKTLLYRGRLRFRRALFRSGRGEDPTGDFRTAEEDLGRVLALNPTHAEARAERGAARFQRALWRHERGDKAGARQTYAAAADDLKEAVRLDPRLEASVGESRRLAEKRAADPATP